MAKFDPFPDRRTRIWYRVESIGNLAGIRYRFLGAGEVKYLNIIDKDDIEKEKEEQLVKDR